MKTTQIFDSDFGPLSRERAVELGIGELFDAMVEEHLGRGPCTCQGGRVIACEACGHEEWREHHQDCPTIIPLPFEREMHAKMAELWRDGRFT